MVSTSPGRMVSISPRGVLNNAFGRRLLSVTALCRCSHLFPTSSSCTRASGDSVCTPASASQYAPGIIRAASHHTASCTPTLRLYSCYSSLFMTASSAFSWLRAAARRQSSLFNQPLRPSISRPLLSPLSWPHPCFLPSEQTLLRSAIFFHETRGGYEQHHQHRSPIQSWRSSNSNSSPSPHQQQHSTNPAPPRSPRKPSGAPNDAKPSWTSPSHSRHSTRSLKHVFRRLRGVLDAFSACSLRFWITCGRVRLCSWRRMPFFAPNHLFVP